MPDLEINVEKHDAIEGCVIVVITGGVTAGRAAGFQGEVKRKLPVDVTMPIFDMSKVDYLASSGFSYLVDLANTVDRRGGVTVLVDVQPKVRVVLDNLGIARFFTLCNNMEEASTFMKSHADKLNSAPRVIVTEGPLEGTQFPLLGSAIRIGGDPRSTIPLRYPGAEFRHAEIYRTGEQCHVKDLGSSMGVFIQERKIYDEALKAGDIVTIGRIKLMYIPAGAETKQYYKKV